MAPLIVYWRHLLSSKTVKNIWMNNIFEPFLFGLIRSLTLLFDHDSVRKTELTKDYDYHSVFCKDGNRFNIFTHKQSLRILNYFKHDNFKLKFKPDPCKPKARCAFAKLLLTIILFFFLINWSWSNTLHNYQHGQIEMYRLPNFRGKMFFPLIYHFELAVNLAVCGWMWRGQVKIKLILSTV